MVFHVGSSYNRFSPQIMSRHGIHFHLEIKCKLAKRGVLQKHAHIDFSLISAALLRDTLKSHQGEKRGRKKTQYVTHIVYDSIEITKAST